MKGIKEKVYHAWKTGTYPSPATKTLGIKIIELSEGRSLVEMQIDEHLHNNISRRGLYNDGDEDQFLQASYQGTIESRRDRGETRKKGGLRRSGPDESAETNHRQSEWHVALPDDIDFQISVRPLPSPDYL